MTTPSTIPGKRPPFRPRPASKPYNGPPTPLQRFLAEHADVIALADRVTHSGPVPTETVLDEIAQRTGKDRTTAMQALYGSGRIWYDWLLPLGWWQRDTLQAMLEKSRAVSPRVTPCHP